MKQFLRLMAMLWPKKRVFMCADPRKAPVLPGLGLAMGVILFLLACYSNHAYANPWTSKPIDSVTRLQIGDTIPDYLWHMSLQVVNHPEGKDTITLNDYRGKLIILDFWGTFCSACISAMPTINGLEQQFAEEMAVIPVSWSKPELTLEALQSHEALSPLGLSSAVEAQPLINAFPHRVVPFYVWISQRGEVVATTGSSDVTPANITKVFSTLAWLISTP